MIAINDLKRDEISELMSQLEQPAYRATQICDWLFRKRATSFDQMTNLPLNLRKHLAENYTIKLVELEEEIVSPEDGATKYLLRLHDGGYIESVFLPHQRGATLCISSQVGCAFGCRFCATGRMGLTRNLSPGEIVDQVNFVRFYLAESNPAEAGRGQPTRPFTNVVFMGMGEPLANFENVVKAIEIMIQEVGIGSRHITVSTCAIPEKIVELAQLPYEIKLAISLNSPSDQSRREIMPEAAKFSISEVLSAARYYYSKKKRLLTIEYVLIADLNDSPEDAEALARLPAGLPVKINLIALNPFPGCAYRRPTARNVKKFVSLLEARGMNVTLRKSLGSDILAGCGQLGMLAQVKGKPQGG